MFRLLLVGLLCAGTVCVYAQGDPCQQAFDQCDFYLGSTITLQTFSATGLPDRPFTPFLKLKNEAPGTALAGVSNSNSPGQFILPDGSVVPFPSFPVDGQPFSASQFKPYASHVPAPMGMNGMSERIVIADTSRWWEDGVVYYTIEDDFSAAERLEIDMAMAHISASSCVTFVERTNEPDYVDIVNNDGGCFSLVGRGGGSQPLNLAQPGCFRGGVSGTVVHELLHAIGFYHEHSRPDRDEFVEVLVDNIDPENLDQYAKEDAAIVNLLDTPYDYGSIMHYSNQTFAISDLPTMVALPPNEGVEFGQRDGLSELDIERLNKMHNCVAPGRKGSGIGHETYQVGQKEASKGQCVRVFFSAWQLIDATSENVIANVNVPNVQGSNCVVFRTEA
mmetsp:Transcript_280/g.674  ORF Transcript_280/g.674 Transcript_280/m.674 type:complete len:391 (-) Transcript_280:186-1358(-)|eukprot:CAMPEP_0198332786 /NCGR_PEP_ID=MMETSP1450-20131203/18506_1 /TAXON_ID=753684 ORGANISM="Madagascaria erythrocladiodes, Strain CCMP3234" /NCGR_SAMPLE_ID=MMETSP1450 /ASSEMBLY_ACC=CAM_ASM_001115 /LENGTH=390 /DNA_ID=CAMNT_0044037255 /DNA_START=316 /DNA_END=1488 /DNA_ORIENTATION=-